MHQRYTKIMKLKSANQIFFLPLLTLLATLMGFSAIRQPSSSTTSKE
jgi:hypothetical protein